MSIIEVAIGPDREPGRYRVEVVRSPDGEASAVTDLDVDALSDRRSELERAVLVSSVPTRKVFPEEQRVQEVGQALFRALLGTGEVAGRYRAAAALAAHSSEGLRVVLRIFARGFYAAIVRGRGVDDAMTSGRVAIMGLGDRTIEWLTPVLYLRVQDSHLFTVLPPGPTPSPGVQQRAEGPSQPPTRSEEPAEVRAEEDTHLRGLGPSQLMRTFSGHAGAANDVAFSPNAGLLASGGEDRTVRLWETLTGTPLRILIGHTKTIRSVAFSPDRTLLASAGADGTVRLWDTASGGEVRILTGHAPGEARGVAFSRDGILLASVGGDGIVRVWEPPDGNQVRALTGHANGVSGVEFSPDQTEGISLLASAGDDRTVRIWEITTGTQVRALEGHAGQVLSVAFNVDGSMVASASEDGTVRLWE